MVRLFPVLFAAAAAKLRWPSSSFGAHAMVITTRNTATEMHSSHNDAEHFWRGLLVVSHECGVAAIDARSHCNLLEMEALGFRRAVDEPPAPKVERTCDVSERWEKLLEEETKRSDEKDKIIKQQQLVIADLSATLHALTSSGRNSWGAERPSVFGDGDGDGDDTHNFSDFADNDDWGGARNGHKKINDALIILVFALIFIVQMDHMASRKRKALVLFGVDPDGQHEIITSRTLERRSVDPYVAYIISSNFAREALVLFGTDPDGQHEIITSRTLERRSVDPYVAYIISSNFATQLVRRTLSVQITIDVLQTLPPVPGAALVVTEGAREASVAAEGDRGTSMEAEEEGDSVTSTHHGVIAEDVLPLSSEHTSTGMFSIGATTTGSSAVIVAGKKRLPKARKRPRKSLRSSRPTCALTPSSTEAGATTTEKIKKTLAELINIIEIKAEFAELLGICDSENSCCLVAALEAALAE